MIRAALVPAGTRGSSSQGRMVETDENRQNRNDGLQVCAELFHAWIRRNGQVDFRIRAWAAAYSA